MQPYERCLLRSTVSVVWGCAQCARCVGERARGLFCVPLNDCCSELHIAESTTPHRSGTAPHRSGTAPHRTSTAPHRIGTAPPKHRTAHAPHHITQAPHRTALAPHCTSLHCTARAPHSTSPHRTRLGATSMCTAVVWRLTPVARVVGRMQQVGRGLSRPSCSYAADQLSVAPGCVSTSRAR